MLGGGQFSDTEQENGDGKNKLVSRKYATTRNDQFKNYVDNTYVQNRNQVISPESKYVAQNNTNWPNTIDGNEKVLEKVNNGYYVINKKNLIGILSGNLKLSDIIFDNSKIDGNYIMRSLIEDPNVLYYIESNKISYEDIIKACYKHGIYDVLKKLSNSTEDKFGEMPTYLDTYNAYKRIKKFLGEK